MNRIPPKHRWELNLLQCDSLDDEEFKFLGEDIDELERELRLY
jgi:hypothetical protein